MQLLRLRYFTADGFLADGVNVDLSMSAHHDWLMSMVESNKDTIFFYTIESTDIPDEVLNG